MLTIAGGILLALAILVALPWALAGIGWVFSSLYRGLTKPLEGTPPLR